MFESLTSSLQNVFSRWGKNRQLTADNIRDGLEEIRTALLEADVHFQVARDLVKEVTERAVGQATIDQVQPANQVIKVFSEVLQEAMAGEPPAIPVAEPGHPTVVMMVGLQGSGKTTTTAKLARKLKGQGRRPLLVAADVRRPAAIKQLQILGERLGIPVHAEPDLQPPKICANALKAAKTGGQDVVILDTAGRLHVDEPLMKELEEVAKATKPAVTYLVCDSMAGQDAYTSAREFHGRLDLSALILTKLDGDTRGGAAISVRQVTGRPVAYLGTGEALGDLDEFHADRMASRILGMGDVVSLVEKAQEVMDEGEAEAAAERLLKAEFTFHDFLSQLKALRRMGPLASIMKMLPGGMGQALAQAGSQEGELKRVEAVILSMTEEERQRPDLIEASRKRRIAAGSGTEVSMVNGLLRQFQQLRQMMKQMGGGGLLGKMMGGGGGLGGLFGGKGAGGPAGMEQMMSGVPGAGGGMPSQQELMQQMRRGGGPAGTPVDKAAQRKERKRKKDARKKNRKRR